MHTTSFDNAPTRRARAVALPQPGIFAPGVSIPGIPASGLFARLGRLMESLVEAQSRQLRSPDRQLPPEWFNFPAF